MEYQVLYRKYRSQTFDEIVGQEHIVRTLQNALMNNKIAHAYLFTGPRGTGKTSIARLFAKAVNCEEGFGHICNQCDNCLSIVNGSHPDVFEIDAASNSSVENVREILDRVKYSPIKGRYKVYIIDEVHMLSNSAFNALLKTLEEPPEFVIFILATTEPHKVLPTIVSRCQRFDFTRISDDDLAKEINYIASKEHFTIDDEAKKLLISLSDGGARDCLSILDQLYAYCGKEIKYEDILKVFGLISNDELVDFISNLIFKNTNILLNKLYSYNEQGINIKVLTDNIILGLKDVLIYKTTLNSSILTLFNEEHAKVLSEICSIDNINYLISEFLNCQNEFKNTANIKSFFEITILKLASSDIREQIKIIEEVKVEPKVQPVIKEEIKEVIKEPESIKVEVNQEEKPQIIEHTIEKPKEVYIEPKNISTIDPNKVITYDDNLIIKVLVKSSKFKDAKQQLFAKWNKLNDLLSDKEYNRFITMLKQVTLFAYCNEMLIIKTQFQSIINEINNKDNEETISKIIEYLTGINNIKVFAIDFNEANRLQSKYFNLRQVQKLPIVEIGDSIFNDRT